MDVDPTQSSSPKLAVVEQSESLSVRRQFNQRKRTEVGKHCSPVFQIAACQLSADPGVHQNNAFRKTVRQLWVPVSKVCYPQ